LRRRRHDRPTIKLNGTYRCRAFSAHWAHEDRPTAIPRISIACSQPATYGDGNYHRGSTLDNVRAR